MKRDSASSVPSLRRSKRLRAREDTKALQSQDRLAADTGLPDQVWAKTLTYLTPLEHFQAVPAVSKQLRRVPRLETAYRTKI